MALSHQLKSDMTGTATDQKQEGSPNQEIPKPEVKQPDLDPTQGQAASPAPGYGNYQYTEFDAKAPAGSTSTTEALLGSIERQLQLLNQNCAVMSQEMEKCKTLDFRAVFTKIDSARSSIEKMISAASVQNTEEASTPSKTLEDMLRAVMEKQERNDRQLTQMLRENANFQVQVRQGMQHDLDVLKGQQSGEMFNPLLKEIAALYVEYQGLLDEEGLSGRAKRNLKALFEQMEDLLSDYDAEVRRSEVGSVRQTRVCKVIEKLPTPDEALHNTIARSRKPGVMRGRTVLYSEFVDVYVYDPSLKEAAEAEAAEPEQGKAAENTEAASGEEKAPVAEPVRNNETGNTEEASEEEKGATAKPAQENGAGNAEASAGEGKTPAAEQENGTPKAESNAEEEKASPAAPVV